MLLKEKILVFSSLIILIISFPIGAFGQAQANDTPAARASALQELLDSVEGVAKEPPRVYKTPEGYLRFIMAPPSTHFAFAPGTPEEAADAFLERWRNLFVNKSPPIGFDTVRVTTSDSRSYVRYQQTYAGLDVFGAEMIVQVNAAGGIAAVMSDIMRDTEALDTGKVSLNPTIDALKAQDKAIEWLAAQNPQLQFEASPATLMIFEPLVVGLKGETQLVWQAEVNNVGELSVKEFVLVDAQTGEIAFHYSLIYAARHRIVWDYEGDTSGEEIVLEDVGGEDDPRYPTQTYDVDRIYEYLEDTYEFYWSHHDERDSYDRLGSDVVAKVRYGISGAWWMGSWMLICEGMVADDVVGHEFTHGVTQSESDLIHYGESGAISESFSDMWGEWIDQTNGRGNDSPDVKWYLSEDWASDPWPWRRMDNPPDCNTSSRYGDDFGDVPQPDRYNSDYYYREGSPYFPESDFDQDDGGVHHNLGVGNKLCYLLTDGDTFNGYTISGMGIPDVADLFYECQTNLLTSGSDYHDLGVLLMLAAMNLSEELGLTYGDRYNIEKACRAVEIYNAPSKFYIKNSSGVPVAYFDNLGNLVLKGSLATEVDPLEEDPDHDEFRVQDSGGNDVAIIDTTNGNMYITGEKHEGQDMSQVSPEGFIIKNSDGDVVAYIDDSGDESGHLYLAGKLYQNPEQ